MSKRQSGLPELCRLHAKRYECTIEQSNEIIRSVIETIRDMMRQTDVLALQGFGKFESRYRAPYTMKSNLPDKKDEIKEIPGAYKVKFIASPKLNDAASEFFATDKKRRKEKPSE